MKKGVLFILMVISVIFISACDVYESLYTIPNAQDGTEEVPEGDILIEISEDTEEETTEEETETTEEEMVVEEETGDATIILIEETELVSLVPQAQDPDNDDLIFTFTSPLDENGEWQTTYGDFGEYTITITASDGSLTSTKEVLVIVNKKEEAPVLESFSPEGTATEIDETGSIDFYVDATDLNNDDLTFTWKLDGNEIGDGTSYDYQTTYDDSGSHTVKVIITDDIFDTEKIWSVTVNNVNRNPVLQDIEDLVVSETATAIIGLDVNDPDGDELTFEIDDGRFMQDGSTFSWETTYDDAGEYEVTVSVSDGGDTISKTVKVTVENLNRPPVILDIMQR